MLWLVECLLIEASDECQGNCVELRTPVFCEWAHDGRTAAKVSRDNITDGESGQRERTEVYRKFDHVYDR